MTRRYGRTKCGHRLVAAVPHGHWKTTTFVGALRCDGLTAPLVIDGAINGELFLAYVDLDALQALRSFVDRAGGDVIVAPLEGKPSPNALVAAMTVRTGIIGWAVLAKDGGVPGPEVPTVVVRGVLSGLPKCGPPLDLDVRLRALRPNVTRFSISSECNGAALTFGERFWKVLAQSGAAVAALRQCGPPLRVEYDDRYLLAPVTVRLLWSVLKQLRLNMRAISDPPQQLTVRSLAERRSQRGHVSEGFRDDRPDLQVRAKVMARVLGDAGYAPDFKFGTTEELLHGRTMRLVGKCHVVEIVLDQGFGFWEPTRRTPFGFHDHEDVQAKRLINTAFDVAGVRGRSTDVFVDLRPLAPP